jgi:hypothetical protein
METEINAFLSNLGDYSESTRLAYANDFPEIFQGLSNSGV